MKDLDRVARNCKLDIEGMYNERGGFWIVEYKDGFIGWMAGKPMGYADLKNYFYYEDVINAQNKWLGN